MKTIIFNIAFISIASLKVYSQTIIDTVSVGAGYTNQKWYSLQNDEQGTAQPKDNWDIGFEITGFSASIIANNQKANFTVYKAPYAIENFGTIDTNGINSWAKIYNSDTSWGIGAFNKGASAANFSDLGWGNYDVNTHIITGDSCFVVKLSATTFKKIKIESLSGGIYSFSYANIDGSAAENKTISKASYNGKNFAYFNLTTNLPLDREPTSASWDLTFVKYTTFIPTAYGVSGILGNKGVTIAQADNVSNPSIYSDWSSHLQSSEINTIGYDWKSFDLASSSWKLSADTVFFVKSKIGEIWKLRITGFGGATTGNFILAKEKLSALSLQDENGYPTASFTVYPNPSSENSVTLIYDVEKQADQVEIQIFNFAGQVVHYEAVHSQIGLYKHNLNLSDFSPGIYFISLLVDDKAVTQKFIKQ